MRYKSKIIDAYSFKSGNLHLRKSDLEPADIIEICETITSREINHSIKSISFSYNPLVGNEGAIIFANNLPNSLCEIGLVGCNIGDSGGKVLLTKIEELQNLNMLCIEQNIFSQSMIEAFKQFGNRKNILVTI